jgi:tetratricopeptide (TPR) repeat protein
MTRKMAMRLAGWTWCALAALAMPALAYAQSDAPATQAAQTDGERAAPFFQEGVRAADQKQWNEAEAAYLKAWAIAKAFDIAANLGSVELKLGKPRLAATHLAFSLRMAPPSAKAPNLDQTRRFLEEAKKQIGVLRVRLNVLEAEVSIDGKLLSQEESAGEIFVEPGTHRVAAQSLDYARSEKTVTVQAGSSQEVALSLARIIHDGACRGGGDRCAS